MGFKIVALCALVTLLVFAAHVDALGRRGLKDSQAAEFNEEPHRARLTVRFLADTGTDVVIPEPEYKPNPFLEQINQNNREAAKKENGIQDCISTDGCGTPP